MPTYPSKYPLMPEPLTSNLAKEVVEFAPITTWLEVVETLIPEPLKNVQLTSVPAPPPGTGCQVATPLAFETRTKPVPAPVVLWNPVVLTFALTSSLVVGESVPIPRLPVLVI